MAVVCVVLARVIASNQPVAESGNGIKEHTDKYVQTKKVCK